jgi:hypothetical protein
VHGYDECRYPTCVAVVGAGLGLLALRSLADRHVEVGDLGRGHHHAREVLAELALAACWGRVLASRGMALGQVQDRVAGPPGSQLVAVLAGRDRQQQRMSWTRSSETSKRAAAPGGPDCVRHARGLRRDRTAGRTPLSRLTELGPAARRRPAADGRRPAGCLTEVGPRWRFSRRCLIEGVRDAFTSGIRIWNRLARLGARCDEAIHRRWAQRSGRSGRRRGADASGLAPMRALISRSSRPAIVAGRVSIAR